MNEEQTKQAALASAAKNGGKLKRLTSGRWQGVFPGPQFEAGLINELVQEGKVSVSARTEGVKNDQGEFLHGLKGFPTEVTVT